MLRIMLSATKCDLAEPGFDQVCGFFGFCFPTHGDGERLEAEANVLLNTSSVSITVVCG